MAGTTLCGIILPDDPAIHSHEDGLPECLLFEEHTGDHLCEPTIGWYIRWHSSTGDCIDQGCPDYPDCDCFDYEQISSGEALKILNDQSKKRKNSGY